ncbi:MAG TPA: tRNA (adenosine(37)-N6)-threonylcarbamoyltransferase complex transferase subunit TsaD [Dehalococcoidia bacterium]
MRVLGIETSCDECGVGIVDDGGRVLANVIASQVELHARYGGVVPEVASRQHLRTILPAVEEALAQADTTWREIDLIAVTAGPGLVGSLLVGVNAAKALAYARDLPLLGVHHLEGHVYANWLDQALGGEPPPRFPCVALIVSGGHTDLVLMEDHGRYRRLGRTRDDAAGEAFDKVARLLGLGFPGGPAIQRVAEGVQQPAVSLPRAWLQGTADFSFSGLKTAVLRLLEAPDAPPAEQVAAAFQESVVDVLVSKTLVAAEAHGAAEVLLAGGVAANSLLRRVMRERSPVPVRVPPPKLCTDNGTMIAGAAFYRWQAGDRSDLSLDAQPGMKFAS